jgi:hypothetical protein
VTVIGLVACSKTKKASGAPAALLYSSALFRKSLLYSLTYSDKSYILSAKHGLLDLNAYTRPYELTLKNLDSNKRQLWAENVGKQLIEILKPKDRVRVLAGRDYYTGLLQTFAKIGCRIDFPLGNLAFGSRLSLLTSLNDEVTLQRSFRDFYEIMQELYVGQNGGRILSDSTGRLSWPRRGVYFFLENDGTPSKSLFPTKMPRIVRVGTHAVSSGSKTTLWDRLSTHRGVSSGGGSHRSSIFRLHIGRTLLNSRPGLEGLGSWGVGQNASQQIRATEAELESEVSKKLGAMKVLWLDVDDEPAPDSDRAFIEQSSIGILSRYNVLAPQTSDDWLGRHSIDYRIALSGLWNLNYTFRKPHPAFLQVLREYVDITLSRATRRQSSIAPPGWSSTKELAQQSLQLNLFPNGKD